MFDGEAVGVPSEAALDVEAACVGVASYDVLWHYELEWYES